MLEWFTNKSVQFFAAGISKAQLRSLRIIRVSQPGIMGKELYEKILASRPFYDAEKIEMVIKDAEDMAIKKSATLHFRDVVESLVLSEYQDKNFAASPKQLMADLAIIHTTVNEIIPADL